MKAAKRKELVNELRNAHFYMGFDKKPKYNSEYKKEYKEYPLEYGISTNNLRKSNFELGQETGKELYQSMMKCDYQKPKELNPSKLSKETIKDLRQHHFYLGSDKIKKQSEAQEQFDKKAIDPSVFMNRQSQVNELRRHKHEFGDYKNDYSTMYDCNNYNSKPNNLSQLVDYPKTKEEIKKQIIGLRKTNLCIGNHTPQYLTTQQNCFSTKFAFEKPITFDKNLKRSHFEFGGEQIAYKTTVQDEFYPKKFIPNKLDLNLVKDLRATHFSIGNEQPNYQTENIDKYQGKPLEQGAILDKQKFYKGFYKQGDPDLKDIYTSSYVFDYDKTQPGKTKFFADGKHLQNWDPHKLHASTFGLGNDKSDWVSESRQNFINYPNAEIQKLEEKTKQDLRQHHTDFGIDKNDWKTEHQSTYFDKSGPRIKMPDEMLKDLRNQHFVYGFNANNYSVSSEKIGKYQGLPAKLDEKLQKELRTHHQIQPNNEGEYGTIYKEQFLWKTPIDN